MAARSTASLWVTGGAILAALGCGSQTDRQPGNTAGVTASDEGRGGPSTAGDEETDGVIAVVRLPGGTVTFVEERIEGEDLEIGFWEEGDVDLGELLDEHGATALEVFLALAPGRTVPRVLIEHHRAAAARNPLVPPEPRALAFVSAQLPRSFSNDALNFGGSDSARSCWGWAGTSAAYSSTIGYQAFSYSSFQSSFNSRYSQIPGGLGASSGADQLAGGRHFGAPEEGVVVTTSAGHRRALAACMSRAVSSDSPPDPIQRACYRNKVRTRIDVEVATAPRFTSWSRISYRILEGFGVGVRYRSSYTTSGAARRYRLYAEFQNPGGEFLSYDCRDEVAGVWRSLWSPPLGT